MKVLIVGAGGREHALAWRLARCSSVTQVFVAPGNGGTERQAHVGGGAMAGCQRVPIDSADFPALVEFVRSKQLDLTVVGPEGPISGGIVDHFRDAKLS